MSILLKNMKLTISCLFSLSIAAGSLANASDLAPNEKKCQIEVAHLQNSFIDMALRGDIGWAIIDEEGSTLSKHYNYLDAFENLKAVGCTKFAQKECSLFPGAYIDFNYTDIFLKIGGFETQFSSFDSLFNSYDSSIRKGVCRPPRFPSYCEIRNNQGEYYVSLSATQVGVKRISQNMSKPQAMQLVGELVRRKLCINLDSKTQSFEHYVDVN